MPANVFVLGLDELNLQSLRRLPSDQYAFHPLFHKDELVGIEEIDLPALLARAQQELESFDGSIDAIIGYWDVPVTLMLPILCERFGLTGPPLDAVVRCEHKYWSRLEQQKVISEIPGFGIVDLDEPDSLPPHLDFPVWLKPVKSVSSELAFSVTGSDGLREAKAAIREGAEKYGAPLAFALEQIDLPPEIAEVGATACLAEEAVEGRQVTVEGYCTGDETHIYGIVDSITYPDSPSFLRYQYPSQLPDDVCTRLADLSTKVVEQVGLTSTTFNIEYFWDADHDRIRLLEVNPRHSQSHALLFEHVDGTSNHELQVQLALGRTPRVSAGAGAYGVAAKWFLRAFDDGVVTRSPSREEVERIEREIPGVTVHVVAETGTRLSDLPQQDSYSYELARIYMGAADEAELVEDKYERCREMLTFEIEQEGARG